MLLRGAGRRPRDTTSMLCPASGCAGWIWAPRPSTNSGSALQRLVGIASAPRHAGRGPGAGQTTSGSQRRQRRRRRVDCAPKRDLGMLGWGVAARGCSSARGCCWAAAVPPLLLRAPEARPTLFAPLRPAVGRCRLDARRCGRRRAGSMSSLPESAAAAQPPAGVIQGVCKVGPRDGCAAQGAMRPAAAR